MAIMAQAMPIEAQNWTRASFGFGCLGSGMCAAFLVFSIYRFFIQGIGRAPAISMNPLDDAELQPSAATSFPLIVSGRGHRTAGVAMSEGRCFGGGEAMLDSAPIEAGNRKGDVRAEAKRRHGAVYMLSASRSDKLQARLGLSEAQLQKVVVALPAVLGYNFESNVEPSLAKLQARLGLSEAQLQKVVVTLPAVLSLNFESNIEPKLDFLQAELDLSLDALRGRVLRRPALLGYSQARRYAPRLDACREVGADAVLVVDRVAMTDARFYASIGWAA